MRGALCVSRMVCSTVIRANEPFMLRRAARSAPVQPQEGH